MFVYEHLLTSKIMPKLKILSEEMIQEILKPDKQFAQTVNEMESYTRDMKKPLIELFSASLLLPISAMNLHVEPDAFQLIVLLEAVMIVVFLITFVQFARMFLKMQKMKGGGPLV